MICEDGIEYRVAIRYADGSYSGGLHCGQSLEVEAGRGIWVKTRMKGGECDDGEEDYYLSGVCKPGEIPRDLPARRICGRRHSQSYQEAPHEAFCRL